MPMSSAADEVAARRTSGAGHAELVHEPQLDQVAAVASAAASLPIAIRTPALSASRNDAA